PVRMCRISFSSYQGDRITLALTQAGGPPRNPRRVRPTFSRRRENLTFTLRPLSLAPPRSPAGYSSALGASLRRRACPTSYGPRTYPQASRPEPPRCPLQNRQRLVRRPMVFATAPFHARVAVGHDEVILAATRLRFRGGQQCRHIAGRGTEGGEHPR